MLQELYDRWAEIQKRNAGSQTAWSKVEHIAEELNLLEALHIIGCRTIPGETSDIQTLINDRHLRMDEALRERKK